MGNVGPLEVLIVLIITLIVFGPKRLPELGRSLGSGIRGFKASLEGADEEEGPPQQPTTDRSTTTAEAKPGETAGRAAKPDAR